MRLRLKDQLVRRFDEEVRFFKGWQKDRKAVGAVIPTSNVTARRMASVVDVDSGLPVLELARVPVLSPRRSSIAGLIQAISSP